MRAIVTVAVLFVVVLAGCGAGGPSTPTATTGTSSDATATDTATPAPADAATETLTDTGGGTAAPDETSTATPSTTATRSPSTSTPAGEVDSSDDGSDANDDSDADAGTGAETETRTSTETTARTTSSRTVEPTTSTPTTSAPTTDRSTSTATAAETTTRTTTQAPTTSTPTGPQTQWTVEITRVVDGDTMEVEMPDGSTETVRLLGVDTPEVHTENDPAEFEGIPTTAAGEAHLRDWGHRASDFASKTLEGETVSIRTDPAADRRGSYDRLLVYVVHDGENFNRALIDQGFARMYDSEFSHRSAFASAETTARNGDVGLWNYAPPSTSTPTSTATASPTPVPDGGSVGELSVAEIRADAPGNDHENLNEEYLVFENTGDAPLDLTGWTVLDEADHDYTFPSVTLRPGETVTLHTGSGSNGDGDLYWGSGRAVWNNGGDTIVVRDETGTVVVEREYS